MTDEPIINPDDMGGDLAEMQVEERRGASLTLREDDAREVRAASMEAANQALAGALKVMYRLLQVTMIALIGLFVATGHQSVQENQRGVKVRLGRVTATDLPPGSHLSLPRPFGQVIAVDTRPVDVDLDEAFFPYLPSADRAKPFEEVRTSGNVDPARDGSMITADRSLAHARWSFRYTRTDPEQYLRAVLPKDEERLVRDAVERAIVRVVAGVTLDDLQRADEREAVFDRVRSAAQTTLDELSSGLSIIDVSAQRFYPPSRVLRTFTESNTAVSEGEAAKEKAQAEANATLTSTAGGAARPLLALIESYERAIDARDDARAEDVLNTVFAVLDGEYANKALTVDGQSFGNVVIAGDAAVRLSAARAYRQKVANEARSRAEVFLAKLPSFQSNPHLFMTSERARAFEEMTRNSLLKVFMIPRDLSNFQIRINDDPEQLRDLERAEREKRRKEAEGRRLQMLRDRR
ncbi:MAG: hypothetical protein KDA20_02895 [Phycisphaerales bacterium]|nr:hypothetical protein [Phycisphaerales bacterium]